MLVNFIFCCFNFATLLIPLAQIEIAFNHKIDCLNIIKNLIDKAETSIHILTFYFTNNQIFEALVEAKKRGVKIYIIADRYQENCEYSVIRQCKAEGIEVFIDLAKRKGLAHNKIIIIDKKIVLTGSYNLTAAAQNKNDENVIIFREEKVGKIFYNIWLKLLQDAKVLE